ncbi:MAG: acetate--CoA ligase, partial [Chloroflexi bacterium]|nr:acetate--CoA ligase [Chloroflexota bacterium]
MADSELYAPSDSFASNAYIKNFDEYKAEYDRSISDPEGFWAEKADEYHWFKKWDSVREFNYDVRKGPVSIKWFEGGQTNIAYNCLDRHLETKGDQTAIIWEGNEPGEQREITYNELHTEVSKFANVLKSRGVKKGDRVSIYMPMIPELAVAMLACARIGAIHSIVFGGFSADALGDRIADATCTVLLTTNGTHRGAKPIEMKTVADEAMAIAEKQMGKPVETCIVVERIPGSVGVEHEMKDGRDEWYHDVMADADPVSEAEPMESEDPLFILYTSGSTGKPKGVLHTTAGYMVYASQTHKYVFDYHDGDIFFCTADIGWVTGHSYIVYGPLANGATTIMFEGIPTYPAADRFWQIVEKWDVNQFYTAPTAIRAIASLGDDFPDKYDMPSLKLLGSVGEPINPEAWRWYNKHVGKERSPIVDTWWQTETGGILITPLPGAVATKPGAATLPFFGVEPEILDPEKGTVLEGNGVSGVLALKATWPGQMRTLYGDHKRFEQTYFDQYKGYYFTGDGSTRDEDGYYWVTGRVDDVINVSGHRMGTAEVESALVLHEAVAEAAVVGFPHDIKGQGIYAYVTLNVGQDYTDELKTILR